MPGLNGIELLESVKRFDEDIPTIIITAYGTVEAAVETMQKGAFDFMTKPFRKEQILFTIERALKWVRLQRENKMLREQLKKSKSESDIKCTINSNFQTGSLSTLC